MSSKKTSWRGSFKLTCSRQEVVRVGEHVTAPQSTTDIRPGNTMKTEVIYLKIESNDSLLYVQVIVQEIVELQALIDSL
jgi:hypothetical protein